MPNVRIPGYGVVKFPDSMSQAQIATEARKLYQQRQPLSGGQQLAAHVADWLPAAGGAVGGLLGAGVGTPTDIALGPLGTGGGAVVGAGLGGAAGHNAAEIVRQLAGLPTQDETVGQALANTGTVAGIQSGAELAGGLAGKAVGSLARGVGSAALKATPEVAQTAIREGLTASKAGLDKAVALAKELGLRLRGITDAASQQGWVTGSAQLLRDVNRQVLPGMSGTPADAAARAEINDLSTAFIKEHPSGTINATDLHALKQKADDLAQPIYDRMETMNPPTPVELVRANWYKQLADRSRELLGGRTPDGLPLPGTLPGYADINDRLSPLIRAKQALVELRNQPTTIRRIVERGAGPVAGGTIGAMSDTQNRTQGALLGAGAGAVATSPVVLSLLSQLLGNPLTLGAAQQAPRAIQAGAQP